MELDFVSELKIDKFALDDEALYHSERAGRWIRMAIDATDARDKAKERLTFIEAHLDNDIRKNWEMYCPATKMTETGVLSTVRRQQSYVDANTELMATQRNLDICKGAVDAFRQRKDMIEVLVQLFLGGYYSRPVIPEESKYKAMNRAIDTQGERLSENPRIQQAAEKRRIPTMMKEGE